MCVDRLNSDSLEEGAKIELNLLQVHQIVLFF